MSAKGMSLNYVNPIMRNGEHVIELKKEEIEKATEEWKQALILYVVGESPTIAAIERYIGLQVNTVSKPKKTHVLLPHHRPWPPTFFLILPTLASFLYRRLWLPQAPLPSPPYMIPNPLRQRNSSGQSKNAPSVTQSFKST
ncbi:hypothetical protein MTR67_047818 [Solanum verrucosum]|uniref:Uncharacterized protein n=1 Tax=Solanum verrucosum TaxID=315347 RepID=A0AAF0V0A9_SOLVR|nr:hypothetical protein MTR67_047818 [Solanum verrucosum]